MTVAGITLRIQLSHKIVLPSRPSLRAPGCHRGCQGPLWVGPWLTFLPGPPCTLWSILIAVFSGPELCWAQSPQGPCCCFLLKPSPCPHTSLAFRLSGATSESLCWLSFQVASKSTSTTSTFSLSLTINVSKNKWKPTKITTNPILNLFPLHQLSVRNKGKCSFLSNSSSNGHYIKWCI